MARSTYARIQDYLLCKYHITCSDGSDCECGWRRMHAHVKERKICKWYPKNSVVATFDLLHEIGHIETKEYWMRRSESEYFATKWAIERCDELGIIVPEKIIEQYQDYIDMEKSRGERRGGKSYQEMTLPKQKIRRNDDEQ